MKGLAVIPRGSIPLGGRILRLGDEGQDVRQLQAVLETIGFYQGPLDGQYGRLSEEAVVCLQTSLGFKPDGLAGPKIIRTVLKQERPKWMIHRVRAGEELETIASTYDIYSEAIRSPLGSHRFSPGVPICIPCRELWLWKSESSPETNATGLLTLAGEEQVDEDLGLPCQCVIDGTSVLSEKKIRLQRTIKVIDGRGLSIDAIRQIGRRLRNKNWYKGESLWIWIDDQSLAIPGAARYLGFEQKKKFLEGIIIAVGPGSTVRIPILRMPSMLSIDLRAFLFEGSEETRLSSKEARHRILLADHPIERQGTFPWAVWRQEHKEVRSKLVMADPVTLEAFYREIVYRGHAGVVITGVEAPTRRLIQLRKKFFAVRQDMNGRPSTYI